MGLLSFFNRRQTAVEGTQVTLRRPIMSDYYEWAALRHQSRDFLTPWEPIWAPDELKRSGWRYRLRRYHEEYVAGNAVVYLIFDNANKVMVGGITIGNIRRGVSQSAHIGYWMGERYTGQGYMTNAVHTLVSHAFEEMRLHRIEAACIPSNQRSIRVLEKAGFQREGLLRSYLRINGTWQDHFIYSLIEDDFRAEKSKRLGV